MFLYDSESEDGDAITSQDNGSAAITAEEGTAITSSQYEGNHSVATSGISSGRTSPSKLPKPPRSRIDSSSVVSESRERDTFVVVQEEGKEEANIVDQEGEGEVNDQAESINLIDSSRLKGYITLVVASTVHYDSAKDSDLHMVTDGNHPDGIVPADPAQRSYAMAVSLITLIVSVPCVIVHFDRFTCLKKVWIKIFRAGSKIELMILLGLMIWWLIATWVLTSLQGIAGPGKGHFNLYFSTWTCLWTSAWTLERWLVAGKFSSMEKFWGSWPNRAPGWILIFVLGIGSLLSTLDLFLNWQTLEPEELRIQYELVGHRQWEWLLFVESLTIPISAGFFLVELFRVTRSDGRMIKSDRENVLEGFCILVLIIFWVPTLFVATTPSGAADQVGNAYFFLWGATIVVTETFLWWIRDWRTAIHEVMRMQQEEYRRVQQDVLKRHQAEAENRTRTNGNRSSSGSGSFEDSVNSKE